MSYATLIMYRTPRSSCVVRHAPHVSYATLIMCVVRHAHHVSYATLIVCRTPRSSCVVRHAHRVSYATLIVCRTPRSSCVVRHAHHVSYTTLVCKPTFDASARRLRKGQSRVTTTTRLAYDVGYRNTQIWISDVKCNFLSTRGCQSY